MDGIIPFSLQIIFEIFLFHRLTDLSNETKSKTGFSFEGWKNISYVKFFSFLCLFSYQDMWNDAQMQPRN